MTVHPTARPTRPTFDPQLSHRIDRQLANLDKRRYTSAVARRLLIPLARQIPAHQLVWSKGGAR